MEVDVSPSTPDPDSLRPGYLFARRFFHGHLEILASPGYLPACTDVRL